jgi:AraC-like DNA-binding protein
MAKMNTVNKTTMLGLGDMNLEHVYHLGNELLIADHFDVKRVFPPYFRTAMPVCIFLKKGYLRGRCNLMDIEAMAPCMSILLPDQILEFTESSEDLEGMVVLMSERFTDRLNIKVDFDLMQTFQSQRVIPLNEEALATMLQFCEMVKRLSQFPDHPFLMETAVNLTRAFFFGAGYFFHQRPEAVAHSRGEQLVDGFLKLVQMHCRQERQLDFYAQELCISSKYLAATVKTVTGKTAGDWIEDYVMLEAKAMLTNTDMTISQISDHLHFPDTSTFGKYFRRHTGLSPKEFKKQSGQ